MVELLIIKIKTMNKKKIITIILGIGIISLFIAYQIYNKPHVNVLDVKSDIIITADKIIDDFSSDETKANRSYLDKIIKVSGTISELKLEKQKGIITLKTNHDFGSVLCHLSDQATQKINLLKVGQTIILKGICTGFLMDVILIKSEIVNKKNLNT
jgi:DNA/RNA endonuclease YhcR with UshA esterase domain